MLRPYTRQLRLATAAVEQALSAGAVGPNAASLLAPDRLRSMLTQVGTTLREQTMGLSLLGLFRRALQDGGATCWVGAEDLVAVHARNFLRGAGVRVPAEISVLGFDDSIEAFANHLSSYNFNSTAMMHALVNGVVRPEQDPLPQSDGLREVDGYVVERATTARLARA